MDNDKKKVIMKILIGKKGKGGPGSGGVGEYAIDDPTKAMANMDSGMPHKKDGKGGPGYMKKGKGGPGDPPIPGLDAPNQGIQVDPTMGGTVSPMGSTPITAGNPAGAPPTGMPPSLPSTLASLPRLGAGVSKSLKPSRFSNIRSSARLGKKSPGAQKGSMAKEKKSSLKGAVRKAVGTKGKSAGPMSSMAKMPSFA